MSLTKKLAPLEVVEEDWIEIDLESNEPLDVPISDKTYIDSTQSIIRSVFSNGSLIRIANDLASQKFGDQISMYNIDLEVVPFDWLFANDSYIRDLIYLLNRI